MRTKWQSGPGLSPEIPLKGNRRPGDGRWGFGKTCRTSSRNINPYRRPCLQLTGVKPHPHEVTFLRNNKSTVSGRYLITIAIVSFALAALFFVLSQLIAQKLHSLLISSLFLIFIVLTGIVFDIVGTAAAAATEEIFHARAAKRVPGAKESVFLVRNADRVANIANDVIGDIAGTVSGAVGMAFVLQIIARYPDVNRFFLTMSVTAVIASLTVSGKAFGKKVAISRANDIIFIVGKVIAYATKFAGIEIVTKRRRK